MDSTQTAQPADNQRDALCYVVAQLVREQVTPSNTANFWIMVVETIQRDWGITMTQHAYARHRTSAIANGGVDERPYLANLFEQRRLDRESLNYPPSMPIPGRSPPVSPTTLAAAALSVASSSAQPLGNFGQMQTALGQGTPPSMGGPATPAAPPGGNTTNTMQLPIRGTRRESDAEKKEKQK